MLISIVIPIYNAEQFIADAMNSILRQDCFDCELVLVNDGSTDNTKAKLEEFASRYNCIKLISQENGGVTSARRLGVEEASGEWITFVDADDIITDNAIHCMKSAIGKFGERSDIIVSSMPSIGRVYEDTLMDIDKYRSAVIECAIYTGPCGKLYRKHLFSARTLNIPRKVVVAEDMLMNIRLSFATEKPVKFLPDEIYKVRNAVNDQSAMKRFRGGWNYDVMFDAYLLDSIPEEKLPRFMLSVTIFRLNIWNGTFRKKWFIPEDVHKSDYYKSLRQGMCETGYNGGLMTYLNVSMRTPFVRIPMDFVWRIGGLFKRYFL